MNAGPPEDPVAAQRCAAVRRRGRFRPMHPRRVAFGCMKLAALVLVLAVIGAGILALRLQGGPIVIDGLGDKIASALHDRFGKGFVFDLGQTSMVQRGFGPTLSIDKLTVSGADHQVVLDAPRAEVSIDPFALVFGKVTPRRLEVLDVTLRLVLLKNGALAIAAGKGTKPFLEIGRGAEPAAPAPVPAQADADGMATPKRAVMMKQASLAIRQFLDILTDPHSAVAAIDRLGITNGKLVIEDQMTGEDVVYSDLDLAFDKVHGVTDLTLSAKGPNGRWSVAAMAKGAPGHDRLFNIKASNLSIDEMQLAAGSRSLGFETDMPIALSAEIGLKSDNTLSEAAGHFDLGPGFFRLDDPDQEPAFVREFAGDLRWNSEDRTIRVDPVRYVESSGTQIEAHGSVKPPHNEGEPWNVDLQLARPARLAPDRKGQQAFKIDAGEFRGRLLLDRKAFVIDRLSFSGADGAFEARGGVDWVKGPHVKFDAAIARTTVALAQRVWPAFMAATVRAWIIDHFEAGVLPTGQIHVDYDQAALKRMRSDRAPPDGSVSLDFTLVNGRLRYLDGVPPIDEVQGVGHITGRTSRFTVNSGAIDADGKKIAVSNGTFFVPNTNRHPTPAMLTAHLGGSVEAITDILSRDALKPYASLPLDAATLHGQVEGTLDKTIMLGTHGEGPDEPLHVSAKVTDFVAEHLVGQESLEDATLDIDVGDGKLKAAGQGKIFGGPATFEIDRAGLAAPTAKIAVTLDDAARAKLGLSAVPGFTGPMTAHVNASLGEPSQIKAQVDIDLAKTAVAAAYLGLSKPAGRAAKVSFQVEPHDGRFAINQVAVDIGALQARGAVDLDNTYAFQGAHFSSFKVSPGDDMRLDVTKGDDTFKLTIRGSTIDARPFLKALTSTPGSDATPLARNAKAEKKEAESFKGFDIDLKAGLLTGFNKEVMNGVDLKLSKRGATYRQFAVHGRFGDAPVSGTMGSSQRLRISAGDAGALVSFIDLYKHMEGGNLSSTLQVSDDSLTGNLEIRDFILRDEPAIRRLVAQSETVSAPGQDARAARRINAGAVEFKRLKVNFERAGSRLQLHDATMYGNEIGLSVDGWLDYVHDRVAMNGTFVPVFALNNMFAQIPVVGMFLGGRSNEGLFAITFRIAGAVSHPDLSINPLSAIAPGFLRNIFGAIDGTGAAPGAAVPTGDSDGASR